MKKWASFICIALLAASCSSMFSSRPTGTLSESQMTELLVDIHLTEATLRNANDSLARLLDTTDMRKRFAAVFRKHEIEPGQFNKSLNYYLEHIEELDKIYAEVIAQLTEKETELIQIIAKANEKSPGILHQEQDSVLLNNPWFRSLNKSEKLYEFQYFKPGTYGLPAKISLKPYNRYE